MQIFELLTKFLSVIIEEGMTTFFLIASLEVAYLEIPKQGSSMIKHRGATQITKGFIRMKNFHYTVV